MATHKTGDHVRIRKSFEGWFSNRSADRFQLQSLFTYKSVGLHLGFQLSLPVGGPVSAFEAGPSADSADIAWASLLGYYDSFCRKWLRDV